MLYCKRFFCFAVALGLASSSWATTTMGDFPHPKSITEFYPQDAPTSAFTVRIVRAVWVAEVSASSCPAVYEGTVGEVLRGTATERVVFCSDQSLNVGHRYLVYLRALESTGDQRPELDQGARWQLVRSWFFPIYEIHLGASDMRDVVKIPRAYLNVPDALIHDTEKVSTTFGGSDEHTTEFNIILWDPLRQRLMEND